MRSRSPNEGEEESQSYFLGEVTEVDDSNKAWTVQLPVQGMTVAFKIDTGADTSVISEKTYSQITNRPKLRKAVIKLDSPGGKLVCLGYFTATTEWKGQRFKFKLVVGRDNLFKSN